jgi:WD40 repeat protein
MVTLAVSLLLVAAESSPVPSSEPRTFTSRGAIRALGFTPDGRGLVSGHDDGLRAWNLQTGDSRRLPSPDSWIRDLVVLRDGRILAGGDAGAYVLTPADGSRQPLTQHPVCAVDMSPDGKTAVLVASDGFHVYVLPGFQQSRTIPDEAQFSNCRNVAVSWDGKHVAGLAHRPDFRLRLWQVADGREVAIPGLGQERGRLHRIRSP